MTPLSNKEKETLTIGVIIVLLLAGLFFLEKTKPANPVEYKCAEGKMWRKQEGNPYWTQTNAFGPECRNELE